MKRALSLIAFGFVFCPWPSRADEGKDGLAYRGIPLGLSLNEFRRRPSPESGGVPVTVICRGDKGERLISVPSLELPISDSYHAIGVTACGYFRAATVGQGLWGWPPEFAGTSRYITTFYFTPGQNKRLFKISITPENAVYPLVIEAITTKYGSPASAAENDVQTGIGARFTNKTTIWKIGGGSIVVQKYHESIKFMIAEFVQDELFSDVDAMARAALGKRGASGL